MINEVQPKVLYKIISTENWNESKSSSSLKLSSADSKFIHFSTEEQLQRIIDKYWEDKASYIVLKIDPLKLSGRLILEANPSGVNKYFHLYEGAIPHAAILNVKKHLSKIEI